MNLERLFWLLAVVGLVVVLRNLELRMRRLENSRCRPASEETKDDD